MTPLEQAVVRGLAWFDLLHYPLTAFECWYYLFPIEPLETLPNPAEVASAVAALTARGVVRGDTGFWQLADSPPWLPERQARARASIAKLRRAAAGARLLRWLPWVDMVAVGNTVAYQTARPESDIDLFIVASPGRLMLARALATTLFQLMGWRQHRQHVTDRLCLNFYVTTAALGLAPWRYADDPYLAYWLAGLLPLSGERVYGELLQANAWAGTVLPGWWQAVTAWQPRDRAKPWLTRVLAGLLGGSLGNGLERLVARPQLVRLKRYLGEFSASEPDVVISADVLKLHTNDRRREFARQFAARLARLGDMW